MEISHFLFLRSNVTTSDRQKTLNTATFQHVNDA